MWRRREPYLIALTVDSGHHAENTLRILDALSLYSLMATSFPQCADVALQRSMVCDLTRGCEFGNYEYLRLNASSADSSPDLSTATIRFGRIAEAPMQFVKLPPATAGAPTGQLKIK